MSLDEHVRQSAQGMVEQLREQLEKGLADVAGKLKIAADAEWAEAVREAQAAAEARAAVALAEAVAAAKAESARTLAEQLAAARAEAGEAIAKAVDGTRAEAAKTLAERLAAASADAARNLSERLAAAQTDATRTLNDTLAAAETETARTVSAAIAATKAEAASALEARLAEHEAARSSALEEAVSAARAEAAASLAAAVAEAFAQERQADLASMEHLLDGMRIIGGARTLTEVLETLTTAVEREAGRAVLLLLRQNRLRGWRLSGFEGAVRPETIDLPADDAGLATQAIRTRAAATTRETTGAVRLAAAVPFADLPADRVGLAIPVEVGGQIVAVAYADDAVAGTEPPVPSPWPEAVEMLVRHAARSIEALTLRRAHGLQVVASAGTPVGSPLRAVVSAAPAQVGAAAAAMVAPASVRAPGPARPAPQVPVVEHDDEAARRYARLLVSEIKLYYEPAVNEGRRRGDLLERLRPEIARARRLYEQRIPAAVLARSEYFDQELVRTLANGDPRLLGQVT